MAIPAGWFRDRARPLFLLTLLLLIGVLVPGLGKKVAGARRWIDIAGLSFQPSELVKFTLILYLADLTSRKRFYLKDLRRGFIPPLVVTGLAGALVLLEPDMGTAVTVLFIGVIMLFTSGARIRHLLTVALAGIPLFIGAILAEPYRVRRMLAFFDPWSNASGAGFQLIQSFIALGSGGVLGVGLGASRQKLYYLPESHTDFIFSIIGEELGFVGTSIILLVFAVLVITLIRLSMKLHQRFLSSTVFGIGALLSFEVAVNIGVSTGILPTKGLPLPFLSYGGTSLVCHMAAAGIILNMAREAEN
jgi:cell division protein FtsW